MISWFDFIKALAISMILALCTLYITQELLAPTLVYVASLLITCYLLIVFKDTL
ncbi:hypothetical protein ACFBZI_10555 [Moraxella sp. ZJ142]|uniref:hypothetical protein n=1 Tax=Moraxella marmotae TaxID=3344520 RepID=UPI0035D46B1A